MKKAIGTLLAILVLASIGTVPAMAYTINGGIDFSGHTPLNSRGEDAEGDFSMDVDTYNGTTVYGDDVELGQTLYFAIGDDSQSSLGYVPAEELTNTDLFSFSLVRDKNCSMLKSVKSSSKKLSGQTRRDYIEVELKSSNRIDEVKMTFDVYFKAKYDYDNSRYDNRTINGSWSAGDVINARFELFITNLYEDNSGDTDVSTGSGVVIRPSQGDTNIIRWISGDDVACLEYEASSDADDFYTKLSTKIDNNVYDNYGDPADADLYFRYFSGTNIDSTSRATLTLYNPWYDDNYVNPERDVYIYRKNSNGSLEDISNQFWYADDGDTDAGIDGWQCKTRTLGSYIISDRQLDLYYDRDDDYVNDDPDESLDGSGGNSSDDATVTRPLPPVAPETGSEDFVGLALLGAGLGTLTLILARRKKK